MKMLLSDSKIVSIKLFRVVTIYAGILRTTVQTSRKMTKYVILH